MIGNCWYCMYLEYVYLAWIRPYTILWEWYQHRHFHYLHMMTDQRPVRVCEVVENSPPLHRYSLHCEDDCLGLKDSDIETKNFLACKIYPYTTYL